MVNLASAHVRSLNFGPDTGTVSCQFQQATGKSTMPSISKWSPVIICICLCSIPYCSSDWVHIAVCNWVEHALRNRILFSFPPGLVWSAPYPLVFWSARHREGVTGRERALVTHSQSVREIEREGSLVFFSAFFYIGGRPVDFQNVFVKNLVEEMRICSNYPMWLESEKQKWGPWQYFKFWQR